MMTRDEVIAARDKFALDQQQMIDDCVDGFLSNVEKIIKDQFIIHGSLVACIDKKFLSDCDNFVGENMMLYEDGLSWLSEHKDAIISQAIRAIEDNGYIVNELKDGGFEISLD